MSSELRQIETIAREAGEIALRFYGNVVAEYKDGDSPVTAADRAANKYIVEALSEAFPEDAILSEESHDSLDRLSANRVWIVDPLDGTKEFMAQNGEFCVMIGLAEMGTPIMGVVYAPAQDVLYSAMQSAGAWVERDGVRDALFCPPINGESLRLVTSRSHGDPLITKMQEALEITDVQICGSVGLKCALIAEGARDLYIHPVPYLKEWDTCAPEIILREAGGTVTDCTGMPLRYNKAAPLQPRGILAGAPGVQGMVLNSLKSVFLRTNAQYVTA